MQMIPPITGDVASVFPENNDNPPISAIHRYSFIEIILAWVRFPLFSEHSIIEILLSFKLRPVEGKT